MRIGVGAENVDVAWYVCSRRSQSSGSNLRCSTTVWPITMARPMNPPGPLWYSGPVVM